MRGVIGKDAATEIALSLDPGVRNRELRRAAFPHAMAATVEFPAVVQRIDAAGVVALGRN